MGKRKHSDSASYDNIMKKIKKLEKKLKRSKRKQLDSMSSSDYSDKGFSPKNITDGENESEHDENIELSPSECFMNPLNCLDVEKSPVASTSQVTIAPASVIVEPQPSTSSTEQQLHPDNNLLELLGADPSITKKYNNEINSDLAVRLHHMVTTGLPTTVCKELLSKYLPPSNCTVIGAPMLNPEIRAAVNDSIWKRDSSIEMKQKQLGSAIACVSEAVTVLLKDADKNTEIIRLLMDASRLMCNCQYNDSITRRNFVLYHLKKDMKDQLQKSKIDEALFGTDLAETLKTAKFISQSGAALKSAPPIKQNMPVLNKPKQPSFPQRNLNWKAPPPNRRQRGTQETREPAQRSQLANSLRQSYRAPPPRKNRNRH